jgi:hypothetical protein
MRGFSKRTIELIKFARTLLGKFHPMTLRQLHYAIFSTSKIAYENTPKDYKRLSRVTTMARRLYRCLELQGIDGGDGTIDPAWIVDETRETRHTSSWLDLSGYMDTVKRAYRRDNWQNQSNYCEVWSEKATVLGSLRPLADDLGITLRNCKGYGSTGMESRIGEDFAAISKPITVFFLGDHDPSGRDIERDIYRRAQTASGKNFTLKRLAIHPNDIQLYDLPPQRIKETDSRAAGFRRRFGTGAHTVELDALPVDELRRRVRVETEALIEWDLWSRQLEIQDVELKSIADFADRMKNLPEQSING